MTDEEQYNIEEYIRFIGAPQGFTIEEVTTIFNPEQGHQIPKWITHITYRHIETGESIRATRNASIILSSLKEQQRRVESRQAKDLQDAAPKTDE